MSATKIKTCGMFRPQDMAAVAEARPDYVGFVVGFPRSHRSVTPELLCELVGLLPSGADAPRTVGVFVDEPADSVARIAREAGLYAVQLHGHEDAAYIARLRRACDARIIQAFRVRSADDLARAAASPADRILLDNGQGTGKTFDWSLLRGFTARPYFLAGGLTPQIIPEAIATLHPYALDLSSALETDGLKDPAKIKASVTAVRTAPDP